MDYGCCRVASLVTIRLWIFGRSNDLEMGIRDWHIIQSCSVHYDRLVYERVVWKPLSFAQFRPIDDVVYLQDYTFDVKDEWYLPNKLDYGTISSH
jgi:hypothetical protein